MQTDYHDNGTITITPTPDQQRALGPDTYTLLDQFAAILATLADLRTGAELDRDAWHNSINAIYRLDEALGGIRDAAIRAHHLAGGSYGNLAIAMDCERATAQTRRDKVIRNSPSPAERWAIAGGAPRQL